MPSQHAPLNAFQSQVRYFSLKKKKMAWLLHVCTVFMLGKKPRGKSNENHSLTAAGARSIFQQLLTNTGTASKCIWALIAGRPRCKSPPTYDTGGVRSNCPERHCAHPETKSRLGRLAARVHVCACVCMCVCVRSESRNMVAVQGQPLL